MCSTAARIFCNFNLHASIPPAISTLLVSTDMHRNQLLIGFRGLLIPLLLASCADGNAPVELPERTLRPYGAPVEETFTAIRQGFLRGDTLFVADGAARRTRVQVCRPQIADTHRRQR